MGLLRLTHERPEVTADVSVRETARIMAESHIGAIAVRKGAAIVGVFSERDLTKRVVAEGRDPATTRVGDVVNSEIVKVYDSDSVESAASAMRQYHVRHAVIVDQAGNYLALLSERHLLYDVMNALEAKVGDLTGYIMADGPGG
ncbi:MAG TPA: CBS domain-containing protein [Polyangia bacterium]|nr:CBS domain-containing protein [Polyangia bacterium]